MLLATRGRQDRRRQSRAGICANFRQLRLVANQPLEAAIFGLF
jgi:hypothetical protein